MTTFLDLVKARKSCRNYLAKPVEKEKLLQILEAGRLAPSARNRQNWEFIVVTDKALLEKLVPACDATANAFVAEAPAFLAVVMGAEDRFMQNGYSANVVDASIALSFMVLQAEELGIGTCWLGRYDEPVVKEILGVQADKMIVAATPLGYPAKEVTARPRKDLTEITTFLE